MTTIKNVQVEGGFRFQGSDKFLGITVTDPASGLRIIDLELDETQILDLLSGLHRGYKGGQMEVHQQTIPRIGMQHVMVDVAIELDFNIAREMNLNRAMQDAWNQAGSKYWAIPGNQSWNSHNYRNGVYKSALHGYFPWEMSLREIEEMFRPVIGWVKLSNLRTMKDRK